MVFQQMTNDNGIPTNDNCLAYHLDQAACQALILSSPSFKYQHQHPHVHLLKSFKFSSFKYQHRYQQLVLTWPFLALVSASFKNQHQYQQLVFTSPFLALVPAAFKYQHQIQTSTSVSAILQRLASNSNIILSINNADSASFKDQHQHPSNISIKFKYQYQHRQCWFNFLQRSASSSFLLHLLKSFRIRHLQRWASA